MAIKGIDISSWQTNIDWAKVKADGVGFAIIRAGYGSSLSQKDNQFENHIKGALGVGLKVGIYWFGYAYNATTGAKEADICNEVIKGYKDKIELPVFYDWEYDSESYIKKMGYTPTKDLVTSTTIGFMDRMKALGYKTGFYTNWDYLSRLYDYSRLKNYDLWMASYSSSKPSGYDCAIQQYSASGKVNGINGNVDMNWLYKEYGKKVEPVVPQKEEPKKEETSTSETVYVVKAGDMLSTIAKKYNTTWQKLAEYNKISNPDLIYVGQKIKIPGTKSVTPAPTPTKEETKPAQDTVYVVKAGDTLSSIAAKYGTTWQKLAEYNGIKDANVIYGGQKIKIPSTAATNSYKVQVNVAALNCRKGPGTNYGVISVLHSGEKFTVIEEKKDGNGDSWGKFKENGGWSSLKFTKKI